MYNQSKNLSSIPESLRSTEESSIGTISTEVPVRLPAFLEKYRDYMPSRRILFIVGVLLLILLAYVVVPKIPAMVRGVGAMFSNKKSLPVPNSPVTTTQPDKDSDGDGIPDWQEALFSLDPNDPDSNNDGIPDSVPSDLQRLAENESIVTQQDKLILQILSEINKDGGIESLTPFELEQKVQTEILKTAEQVESGFTVYGQSDVTLSDNSNQSIQSYKLTVKNMEGSIPTKDVTRKLYSYISSADIPQYPSYYISSLDTLIVKLLKTPVPRILSDDHLKFINSAALLSGFINKLANDKSFYENTDPYIKTLIIQKNLNAMAKSVDNINLYYSIKK